MAVRGCRVRRAARQELLLLRRGCVLYPRASGPSERARLCLPGAHRHQSLRGTGVRTISGQPGHPAHCRRGADPRRRLPPGPSGRDAPGVRQHIQTVHPGQRRRPQGAKARPGAPSRPCGRRGPARRRTGRTPPQAGAGGSSPGRQGVAEELHGLGLLGVRTWSSSRTS